MPVSDHLSSLLGPEGPLEALIFELLRLSMHPGSPTDTEELEAATRTALCRYLHGFDTANEATVIPKCDWQIAMLLYQSLQQRYDIGSSQRRKLVVH